MTPETLTTILSLIALILYGIGQLFYNRHYRKAKQAQLDAKDSEIASLTRHLETLKELTSPELLKHLKATKEGLEDVIKKLRDDAASKDKQIAQLRTERQVDQDKIQALTLQKSRSEDLALQIEGIDRNLNVGQWLTAMNYASPDRLIFDVVIPTSQSPNPGTEE